MNSFGMTSPGASRRLPTNERLHPGHLAVMERALRLVVQHELLAGQRLLQASLHVMVALALGEHLALEYVETVLAVLLGAKHCHVGTLDECGAVVARIAGERHADARRNRDLAAVHLERLRNRFENLRCEVRYVAALVQSRHEDRELVAAQTGDRVLARTDSFSAAAICASNWSPAT